MAAARRGYGLDGRPAFRYALRHMEQTPVISDTVRNGRPWWQICCGGCLLIVIAAVIGSFILLRVVTGPGIVQRTTLPPNYPRGLEPYHLNEASSIRYLQGKDKSKMLNTVYAPLKLFAKLSGQAAPDNSSVQQTGKVVDALGTDAQYIDTVTITWKGLKAKREDVVGYYQKLFTDAGLSIDSILGDAEQGDAITGIREGIFTQASLLPGSGTGTVDAELVVSYSNK